MISVWVDETWIAADPSSLVRLMMEGRVGQFTPARDLAYSGTEGPLIQFLKTAHYEELGRQILRLLQSLYSSGPEAADLEKARLRVTDLYGWDWNEQVIKGRLTWVTGWLHELTGFLEKAVTYYGEYLQQPRSESVLRLLAYSNRAALRIKLGQAAGIHDMGRAIFRTDDAEPRTPLPAACFNLLNLLLVGINSDVLRHDVENALIDFLVQLPKEVRQRWLGKDPARQPESPGGEASRSAVPPTPPEDAAPSAEDAPGASREKGAEKDTGTTNEAELRQRLRILTDPTYVRFHRLVCALAREAVKIAPPSAPAGENTGTAPGAAYQLQLWLPRSTAGTLEELMEDTARRLREKAQHDDYSEAASLLYAEDIPSSLTPSRDSVSWTLQFARETVSRSERYLCEGEYELARGALTSLAGALTTFADDQQVAPLREEVERRLEAAVSRQEARALMECHEACVAIIDQVEEFCTLEDLSQARRRAVYLTREIEKLKAGLCAEQDSPSSQTVLVLDDLPPRLTAHLDRLRRTRIRKAVEEPRQRLRDEWPQTWDQPVPAAAYRALAECRLLDQENLLEDWDLLRQQLDDHQAHYHFEGVVRDVLAGRGTPEQIKTTLTLALSLSPDLGTAAAPIFGLLNVEKTLPFPEQAMEIRQQLVSAAAELLRIQPLEPEVVPSSRVRENLVQHACDLLRRLIHAYQGVGLQVLDLWRGLGSGFTLALQEARPEVIAEIKKMVRACLDACPPYAAGQAARSDPRNPLILLLEECDRAQELGEAEKMLNAKEPERPQAEERFRRALALGLTDAEQFRRAVVGLYLACHGAEDPLSLQRTILMELEGWVDRLREEKRAVYPLGEEVARKIEEVRQAARVRPGGDPAGPGDRPDRAGPSNTDGTAPPGGTAPEPAA